MVAMDKWMKLSRSNPLPIINLKDFKISGATTLRPAGRHQRISIRNVITLSPEPAVTRSPYW